MFSDLPGYKTLMLLPWEPLRETSVVSDVKKRKAAKKQNSSGESVKPHCPDLKPQHTCSRAEAPHKQMSPTRMWQLEINLVCPFENVLFGEGGKD